MEQPLVSVVIPFYSGIEWLKIAIDSVIKQSYKNFEIIIVNDGSKEKVSDVVNSLNINNIILINKENGGPASARNMGIEKANGKYIAFLDSDDIWMPNKLIKQINFMETNDFVWSQHSYEMFWEDIKKTKIIDTKKYSGNVFKDCFISFKIQTSCVVVLKCYIIDNNIRFPENLKYGEDDFFYRSIAKDKPLGYVDGILSKFRIRGTNAGFNTKIQLGAKAATWDKIKNDTVVLNVLPEPIKFAYKLSTAFNNIINNNCINKNFNTGILSKVLYLIPYSIFKIYSK